MRMFDTTRSRLRGGLLSYFFANPDSYLHLRDIASRVGIDPGNLSRELNRLCREGLFLGETRGRQKYFSLNREYPLYPEIKSIVLKTVGINASLEKIFGANKSIVFAFIYGSYAGQGYSSLSDIDVMLIVEKDGFDARYILREINAESRKIQREINITYFPQEEWIAKLRARDSFVLEVLGGKIIMLKGDEKDLRRLG
jgi:predicted nucleotidyltransferase